ncbi:MAG: phosphate signaling complex protein PhoU [Haloferacaceae archaeon]
MPREQYQDRLEGLRADVLYMSEVVAGRLRQALDALDRKDADLAREVIYGDDEINQQYLDLEGECIDLLALQQPVAGDLRFIAASFKILTDLERIADLAVNIGDYTIAAERDVFPDVDVQRIGAETLSMLEDAMAAYDEEDAERCWEIARRDDEVDEMCEAASEAIVRDLITSGEMPEEEVEAMMPEVRRLLLTVRDLERVGDHAVNVAARTLYMIENDDELLE